MSQDLLAALTRDLAPVQARVALGGDRSLVRQIIGADAAQMLAGVPASARAVLISAQVESRLPLLTRSYPLATTLLLGEEETRTIGIMVIDCPPSGPATLLDLTLLPGLRRQGRGTRAVTALCEVADRLGRTLVASLFYDNPARRLLARAGFVPAGGDDTDIIMERPPNPSV